MAIFFGLLVCYLGIRVAFGYNWVWVPKSILNKKIPSYLLIKVIDQILRFLKFLKKWSYPRYEWLTQRTSIRLINGLMIFFIGLSFALCPPIPLTGLFAYIAIFFISIGLLNDDGIYIAFGYFFTILYSALALALFKCFSIIQIIAYIKNLLG